MTMPEGRIKRVVFTGTDGRVHFGIQDASGIAMSACGVTADNPPTTMRNATCRDCWDTKRVSLDMPAPIKGKRITHAERRESFVSRLIRTKP
jgi:hypothetical protein